MLYRGALLFLAGRSESVGYYSTLMSSISRSVPGIALRSRYDAAA